MIAGLQIGVVGAGMGGLAAASLLHDAGHAVTVYDRFDAPRPLGSGLIIQPVGQAVLDAIGVGDVARSAGAQIVRMFGREVETGRTALDVRYPGPEAPMQGLAVHRSALFNVLHRAVLDRGIEIVPSTDITGREGRYLTSTGARLGPYDLVVDAAGVSSPLTPLRARPLPYGAIWGTVDWPDTNLPPDHLSQGYRRADRMIGALPIGLMPGDDRPKAAVFWSMPTRAYETWRKSGLEAWRAEAEALWPAIAPFLAQITDPDQMTMARYCHGTLRKPWGPGIAHIGDAAHQASPQLGQGANMALLDAWALARALAQHDPADALRAYGLARRWHVRIYQAMSAVFTPQYQSDSRMLPALRDRVLFPVSQIRPIPRVLSHLVCGTLVPPLGSLTP